KGRFLAQLPAQCAPPRHLYRRSLFANAQVFFRLLKQPTFPRVGSRARMSLSLQESGGLTSCAAGRNGPRLIKSAGPECRPTRATRARGSDDIKGSIWSVLLLRGRNNAERY